MVYSVSIITIADIFQCWSFSLYQDSDITAPIERESLLQNGDAIPLTLGNSMSP